MENQSFLESLNKKILNYSLTAATLLIGAETTNAQVWGFDVDPDVTLTAGQSLNITFNGNLRFKIEHRSMFGSHSYLIAEQTTNARWIKRGNNAAKPLSSGYVVSAGVAAGWANNNNDFARKQEGSGDSSGASFFGVDKYIGVRFRIFGSGIYHYGWILVRVTGDASTGITIKSYAYEQTADNAITANGTLPVELTSFNAVPKNNIVQLTWETATEVNNYGFEMERAVETQHAASLQWEKIGFVNGHGNSNSPKLYNFIDNSPLSGTNSYRLKQIDFDGAFDYSPIVDVNIGEPAQFVLEQNYPNPFNPATIIKFNLPSPSQGESLSRLVGRSGVRSVKLAVYDVLGKEAAVLINNQPMPSGRYEIKFDASNLASGIYYYTLSTNSFRETKKMLLMK